MKQIQTNTNTKTNTKKQTKHLTFIKKYVYCY
jgi:hypothetical protein